MKKAIFLAVASILTAEFGLAAGNDAGHVDDNTHKRHVVMGEVGALKQGAAQIIGARFLDVDGNIRRLGDENGAGPVAIVFVDGECPVSARYLGELNDFAAEARKHGVDFYAVMSSPHRTWHDARELRDAYSLKLPILFDPSGDLAARLDPVTFGEAFVINERDRMVYRGRIDDRFAGIGKLRRVIRNHDLLDVFARVHDLTMKPGATASIGCYFEGWKKPALDRAVTFARDIEPILSANCTECHQDGGIAPFSLQNYEKAMERSGMLEYVTGEGLMPPWRPRPEFGRFRDERYLSQTQIDLFAAWTASEDAEGKVEDRAPAVKLPDPGWRLGKPDLVLKLVEPFNVPASGEDVYRYFVIPSTLSEDRVIKAIDFRPGAVEVVHHANFFADYDGRARAEDAKDDEPGFSVFGTGEFMSYDNADANAFGIGGWAPGAEPYTMPEDVGLWLPGQGDIVIEIHYKLNGKPHVDQSEIGFYFADKPVKEYIDGLLIGSQDLDIPAGESAYTRHISMDVPVGFRLVDVMPHMHYIGSKARMTITYPDGRIEPVYGIEDWDLRWQNIYALRKPLHVPAGSRLDAWFVWDNSEDNFDNPHHPPRPIKWGWKSEDEMAEVWLGVIPDDPDQRKALINASNETWVSTDSKPLPSSVE